MDVIADDTVVLVVKGRGTTGTRKPITWRLSQALVQDMQAACSGPTYLVAEFLLRQGLERVTEHARQHGQPLIVETRDAGRSP